MFAYDIYNCEDAVQLLPVSRLVTLRDIRPRWHLRILPQRNSVTSSHGILLAPRFRLGREGAHSGERAARCNPLEFAAHVGRRHYRYLARPSYLYITCCAEEEIDEKDACGKQSRTEKGLCTVVPVSEQIWSSKKLVDSTKILLEWHQQILNCWLI